MIVDLYPEEYELIRRRRAALRLPAALELGPVSDQPPRELMGRLRKLIGDEAMARNAGKWRNRISQEPAAVQVVVASLEARVADGQAIRQPAAYLDTMWTSRKEAR